MTYAQFIAYRSSKCSDEPQTHLIQLVSDTPIPEDRIRRYVEESPDISSDPCYSSLCRDMPCDCGYTDYVWVISGVEQVVITPSEGRYEMTYEKFIVHRSRSDFDDGPAKLIRLVSDQPIPEARVQKYIDESLDTTTDYIWVVTDVKQVASEPKVLVFIMQCRDGWLYVARQKDSNAGPILSIIPSSTMQSILRGIYQHGLPKDGTQWGGDYRDLTTVARYNGEEIRLYAGKMKSPALLWSGCKE